ncbi:MAG: hypothetical protein E7064_02160 [Spirochaetaceae bacterium]|nr:hypothetical protein [Spirochaetaceae bacterium]MBQ7905965.1 hypothetical protein [Spirochaetaceae bacterium]
MKQFIKFFTPVLFITLILLNFSCSRNQTISTIKEENLFSLNYGKYENELQLFNLANLGNINTKIFMKDGFFFIADDNAKKIIQTTSYGDLLGIIYNPETNPEPSFVRKITNSNAIGSSTENYSQKTITQSAQKHPFNNISNLAVDSEKNIFVVDQITAERQEQDLQSKTILKEVVLRFTNEGNFIDYIGQEGPGGTPFPFIKDIFVTKNNELIVTCITTEGNTVFWFNSAGFLKYTIPIKTESIPLVKDEYDMDSTEYFVTIDKIIPDFTKQKLYIKTDYHKTVIDTESNVQSGIEYYQTLLHPLNVENGQFEEFLVIPPYEDVVTDGFSKLTYNTAFDFLGVTESGWFFFMIPDSTGYIVQMIQPNGQRIIKRHLKYNRDKTEYLNFTLSDDGIISALLASNEKVDILWWRTDSLIESIL